MDESRPALQTAAVINFNRSLFESLQMAPLQIVPNLIQKINLLSTLADTQGVDIVYCLFVFVCTVTDFYGEDKASGVKFCNAVQRRPGQGIFYFGELCFKKQNRTNLRAAIVRRICMCG